MTEQGVAEMMRAMTEIWGAPFPDSEDDPGDYLDALSEFPDAVGIEAGRRVASRYRDCPSWAHYQARAEAKAVYAEQHPSAPHCPRVEGVPG